MHPMTRFALAVTLLAPSLAGAQDREELLDIAGSQVRSAFESLELMGPGGGIDGYDNGGRDQVKSAIQPQANSCLKAVDAAIAGGAPASTAITVNEKPMTLADARVKVCQELMTLCKKFWEKTNAAKAADLEPYKKLLKGDKLKLYLERFRKMGAAGPGCRILHGAADFQRASTWYEILGDTNGVVPRWTTRGWRFQGDKQVGAPVERSGKGNDPPSSACP